VTDISFIAHCSANSEPSLVNADDQRSCLRRSHHSSRPERLRPHRSCSWGMSFFILMLLILRF